MSISYAYGQAVNKPVKHIVIDDLAKVANVSTATDYNKYSYTDGTTVYFYSLSGVAPAVSDVIVIMQDQDNYLMSASGYANTYYNVA